MMVGQCHCGEVAFKVSGDYSDVFICHCSLCRKATGSNGIAVVIVKKEAFEWERGSQLVATWRKPVGDWQTWFCKVCGSPLPGANDDHSFFIPAGLITAGGEALKVAHHIFVGSKAIWDVIGDEGKIHLGSFES